MINDIRLSIDFLTHRKRKKLQRELGAEGVLALIDLWLSTARQRPSGTLIGYDEFDIELDANWGGEDGLFVKTLLKLGLIDEKNGVYSLHNWSDRQGWVVGSDERGDKARFSRLAKVNPKIFNELKATGVSKISKEDYEKLSVSSTTVNETSNETLTVVEEAITPSPSPSPAPNALEEANASCPEPEKSDSGQEPDQPENSSEPFCEILLSGGKDKHLITEDDIAEYQDAYPGIDVRQEIRKCQQWNKASPTRRKTKSGIRRHISSWLGRAQDAVRSPPQPVNGTGGNAKTRTDRNRQACIDFVKGAPDAR